MKNSPEKGFIIVTSDWQDSRFRRRLHHVTGVKEENIFHEEIDELARMIMNFEVNTQGKEQTAWKESTIAKKYLGRAFSQFGKDQRVLEEIEQEVVQTADGLLQLNRLPTTYGSYLPSYLEVLSGFAQEVARETGQQKQAHSAVLVGAFTPDTAREFSIITHEVYPDATCTVIDLVDHIRDQISPEYVQFKRGDAFSLPFQPDTVDSVQTNILLKNLNTSGRQFMSESVKREHFFTQANRILKPGGLLLMIEDIAGINEAQMKKELQQTGFTSTGYLQAIRLIDRNALEQVITSNSRSLPINSLAIGANIYCISARKTSSK